MIKGNVFTGITELDKATGGLKPGELVVITGRPAMGKTALAASMLINAQTSTWFLFISLQETIAQLNPRLRQMTGWPTKKGPLLDDGSDESEYETEEKTHAIVHMQCPNFIDIQEYISKDPIGVFDAVIIDSLYHIGTKPKTLFGKKKHNKLFRKLKSLALLIDKPIILLADAHRRIEKKPRVGAPFHRHFSRIKHVDLLLHLFRWEYYGLDNDVWDDEPFAEGDGMLMTLSARRNIPWRMRIKYDSRYGLFK